jgi:hypothetical protein
MATHLSHEAAMKIFVPGDGLPRNCGADRQRIVRAERAFAK